MHVNCFSCRGNADAASPGRGGSNYRESNSQLLIGGALFAQLANVDRAAYDKVAAVSLAPGEVTAVSQSALFARGFLCFSRADRFLMLFCCHTPWYFLSPNDMALLIFSPTHNHSAMNNFMLASLLAFRVSQVCLFIVSDKAAGGIISRKRAKSSSQNIDPVLL